jgi:hypothetical protein
LPVGKQPKGQGERERFIDGVQLIRIEASCRASQALEIHDGRLLDQDARACAIEGGRPQARPDAFARR